PRGVSYVIGQASCEVEQRSCWLNSARATLIKSRSRQTSITSISGCSGNLLPPSPPAEKANARQDQARKASTGDGAGNGRSALVEIDAWRGDRKREGTVGVFRRGIDGSA